MFKTILNLTSVILVIGCLSGAESKDCYSCQGINCLRTSKLTNKATCVDPVDNCVTIFEGSTVVAKGCYSSIPEELRNKCDDLTNSECYKCYKDSCNDRGAISCLQCNSKSNQACSEALTIESTRCPASTTPNSYCYTRKSSGNVERGCLLDTTEQLSCIGDNSCEMCIPGSGNEDACNRESVEKSSGSGSERVAIYSILLLVSTFVLTLL